MLGLKKRGELGKCKKAQDVVYAIMRLLFIASRML